MKFLSGARNRGVSYTVIPERSVMNVHTGIQASTPSVRAKFKEHRFDSESVEMKNQYRQYVEWFNSTVPKEERIAIEDVQALTEQHLLNHGDWGKADGRGIFLDNTATLSDMELQRRGAVRRCMFIQEMGDGTNQQCEQQVVDSDTDYCEAHTELLLAVTQGS